jgi:hypothetical protein
MKKKINPLLYWTPRILSILFILFLALFSLDVFESGQGFWQTALALLMHNIPSIFLAVILVFSWKYEIIGGIAFILGGFLYIFLTLMRNFEWFMLAWIAQISGIAFLIGILFLANWFKKRN